MEHKCKNCLYWEGFFNMFNTAPPATGNCTVKTKIAVEEGKLEPNKIHSGPFKQGDVMAEARGIGTGSEYGDDCELFLPKT